MEFCAHVSLKGVKSHCWVTQISNSKNKPARCELSTPFVLTCSSNQTSFLLSFCNSFDQSKVEHIGTVMVKLVKKAGANNAVEVQSKRWVLPKNGSSYYSRKLAQDCPLISFQLQNLDIVDESDIVFVPEGSEIGTEAAADDYFDDHGYPDSKNFMGYDTATLERQWMLLFPGTIVPGEAGIPLNLTVGPGYARECLKRGLQLAHSSGAQTVEEQFRVLCGVVSTFATYVNERTDDTKPAQIFGGREDCDGLSISTAAMLKTVANLSSSGLTGEERDLVKFLSGKKVYLVAGIASPSSGSYETHMWVMVLAAGHRPLFGECTSVHREQKHFKLAAYAWCEDHCYIFCDQQDGSSRPKIGIEESKMGGLSITTKRKNCPSHYLLQMKVNSSLRKVNIAKYCHHVLDARDAGPGTGGGGRFSKYIRSSRFEDGASF